MGEVKDDGQISGLNHQLDTERQKTREGEVPLRLRGARVSNTAEVQKGGGVKLHKRLVTK